WKAASLRDIPVLAAASSRLTGRCAARTKEYRRQRISSVSTASVVSEVSRGSLEAVTLTQLTPTDGSGNSWLANPALPLKLKINMTNKYWQKMRHRRWPRTPTRVPSKQLRAYRTKGIYCW